MVCSLGRSKKNEKWNGNEQSSNTFKYSNMTTSKWISSKSNDFQSFELFNLNFLQSIKFGDCCFLNADFSLKGEWKKERKKCDLNENENDVLDLPSLKIVTFGGDSFVYCHVAVFESMWWLLIFISFLIHSRSS